MEFYDKIKEQVTELTENQKYQNDGTAFGHEEFRSHLKNSGNKISDKKLVSVFNELGDFMDSIQADTNPYLELWDSESDPNEW